MFDTIGTLMGVGMQAGYIDDRVSCLGLIRRFQPMRSLPQPVPSWGLLLSPPLPTRLSAIRGSFLDFVDDPFYVPEEDSARYLQDGLMVLEDGKIKAFGAYTDLQREYGNIPTTTYAERLIMPGFIDTHIHYPQTEMIAAYGEQLLEWLDQYVFPTEVKFQDEAYAQKVAEIFLDQLLRNGTTTALVFAAVFPQSVDAFLQRLSVVTSA